MDKIVSNFEKNFLEFCEFEDFIAIPPLETLTLVLLWWRNKMENFGNYIKTDEFKIVSFSFYTYL